MRLEARQEAIRSSMDAHFDLVDHVSVRSENHLSAYTNICYLLTPRFAQEEL